MICNCFTDLNIIKEWGCFARQKTVHRSDAENAKKNYNIGKKAKD